MARGGRSGTGAFKCAWSLGEGDRVHVACVRVCMCAFIFMFVSVCELACKPVTFTCVVNLLRLHAWCLFLRGRVFEGANLLYLRFRSSRSASDSLERRSCRPRRVTAPDCQPQVTHEPVH
jgi:hypothetical protein